jgi:hypothetical protein
MNGKATTSSWSRMEDAIKIAVSAWPIVFAAVVAQCFKAWATYKVERGIKLMELEQLVGSNSFASAMKQPFLLRRLDILTLVLFLVWCLSPLGSQSLQRVYSKELQVQTEGATVQVLKTSGVNRLFSPESTIDNNTFAELMQLTSVYQIGAFTPDGLGETTITDRYTHPVIPSLSSSGGDNPVWNTVGSQPRTAYGVPLILPYPSHLTTDDTSSEINFKKYENYDFDIFDSHFEFTCDPWVLTKLSDLPQYLSWSSSETLAIGLNSSTNSVTLNTLEFASANKVPLNGTKEGNRTSLRLGDDWEFSHIKCSIKQAFTQSQVQCRLNNVRIGLPDCVVLSSQPVSADKVPDGTTNLYDFAWSLVQSGNPQTDDSPTTPSKYPPSSVSSLPAPA